jgi:hypothetical protein
MKKFVLCLACALLTVLLPISSLASDTRGFDTPEACAQAIFDALKTQDLEGMEACVAFDELASSFDYQAQAERLQSAMGISSLLPATDAFSCAYNAAQLRRSWYMRVSSLILTAADPTLGERLFSGLSYAGKTDEYAQILEAVATLDTDNALQNVEYLGTITPAEIASIAAVYGSDKNQQTLARITAVWGIDTYTELALKMLWPADSLIAKDTVLIIPVRFVQINGRWLADPNPSVLAAILGINVSGFAAPMPE